MTDTTTPDQGDERRAMTAAYMAFCADKAPDHNEVGFPYFKAAWEARVAQPVAQEAIAWSPAGYNKELAVDSTGKVRGEVCEHSIDPRWDARANDTRLGEYLNRDQAKAAVLAALAAPQPSQGAPIDMVLHCPACGMQHIDAPEELPMPMPGSAFEGSAGWTNPPHRSHLCHGCGHIWRPADVPTNGVAAVKTKGEADSQPASAEAGKGVPFGYWHEGPTEDESEFFLAKDLPNNECQRCFPLYRSASESVAVSGEVSDEQIDACAATLFNHPDNGEMPLAQDWLEDVGRPFARAVLALAGSGKGSEVGRLQFEAQAVTEQRDGAMALLFDERAKTDSLRRALTHKLEKR